MLLLAFILLLFTSSLIVSKGFLDNKVSFLISFNLITFSFCPLNKYLNSCDKNFNSVSNDTFFLS